MRTQYTSAELARIAAHLMSRRSLGNAGSGGGSVTVPTEDMHLDMSALSGISLPDQTGSYDASFTGLYHIDGSSGTTVFTVSSWSEAVSTATNSGTATVSINGSTLEFGAGTIWGVEVKNASAERVAYYPCFEGADVLAHDTSGNGNHATITLSDGWTTGTANTEPLTCGYMAYGPNLMEGNNASFEGAGNWSGVNATLTTNYDSGDTGHDSCMRVVQVAFGSSSRMQIAGPSNFRIDLVSGADYRVKFDYKPIVMAGTNEFTVYLAETDINVDISGDDLSTGTWHSFETTGTASGDGSWFQIYIASGSTIGAANNEVLIDNVEFYRINDVTTPALDAGSTDVYNRTLEYTAGQIGGVPGLKVDFSTNGPAYFDLSSTVWLPAVRALSLYDAGNPYHWPVSWLRQSFLDTYSNSASFNKGFVYQDASGSFTKLWWHNTALTDAEGTQAITDRSITVTRMWAINMIGDSMLDENERDFDNMAAKYKDEFTSIKVWMGDRLDYTGGALTGSPYAIDNMDWNPIITNPSNYWNTFPSMILTLPVELQEDLLEPIFVFRRARGGTAFLTDETTNTAGTWTPNSTYNAGATANGTDMWEDWQDNHFYVAMDAAVDADYGLRHLCTIASVYGNDANWWSTTDSEVEFASNFSDFLTELRLEFGNSSYPVIMLRYWAIENYESGELSILGDMAKARAYFTADTSTEIGGFADTTGWNSVTNEGTAVLALDAGNSKITVSTGGTVYGVAIKNSGGDVLQQVQMSEGTGTTVKESCYDQDLTLTPGGGSWTVVDANLHFWDMAWQGPPQYATSTTYVGSGLHPTEACDAYNAPLLAAWIKTNLIDA